MAAGQLEALRRDELVVHAVEDRPLGVERADMQSLHGEPLRERLQTDPRPRIPPDARSKSSRVIQSGTIMMRVQSQRDLSRALVKVSSVIRGPEPLERHHDVVAAQLPLCWRT